MDLTNAVSFYVPKRGSDLELLPCPFCGHRPLYVKYKREVGNRYAVVCLECLAQIDPGWATDKYTVQKMWNGREKDYAEKDNCGVERVSG